MRRTAIIVVLGLASLTAGCGTVQGLWSGQDRADAILPGQLEPIHAAAIGPNQAVFWVSSNGCTSKDDLTAVVRRAGDGSVITVRRIKEDRCAEVQPQGVEMRWSFEELGLEPGARVSVENPYQLTPSA
jgi:predicted small secreted protein